MELEKFTGKTEIRLKVHYPISGIVVTKDGNMAGEKIEVKRINGKRGKNETVCPSMELAKHFEYSGQGDGLYLDKDTGSRGLVGIGINGRARLSDQRHLVVELTGLEAGSNYGVYGFEDGDIVERVAVYDPMVINSDLKSMEYGIEDQELLALPFENLVKVEITKDNGEDSSFTVDELKAKMENENEICCIEKVGATQTVHYGFRDLALLDVEGVRKVEIFKTAGNSYELVFIDQA